MCLKVLFSIEIKSSDSSIYYVLVHLLLSNSSFLRPILSSSKLCVLAGFLEHFSQLFVLLDGLINENLQLLLPLDETTLPLIQLCLPLLTLNLPLDTHSQRILEPDKIVFSCILEYF